MRKKFNPGIIGTVLISLILSCVLMIGRVLFVAAEVGVPYSWGVVLAPLIIGVVVASVWVAIETIFKR